MSEIPEDVIKAAEDIAHENFYNWRSLADHIARAILAERERCATIAEDHHVATEGSPNRYTAGFSAACEVIAQAIRSSHG